MPAETIPTPKTPTPPKADARWDPRGSIAIAAALGAAANPDATEAEIEQAVNDALDRYEATLAEGIR